MIKLRNFMLAFIAMLILAPSLKATDMHELSVVESTGPYVEVNGTPLPTGDDTEVNQTIGFPFEHDGIAVTDIRMSPNGWLMFNSTTEQSITLSLTAEHMFVSPFNRDLHPYAIGTIMKVERGTAPKREAVFQWKDISLFGVNGTLMNFQVILREGSNEIEFRYGACNVAGMGTRFAYAAFSGLENGKYINIAPGAPESTFYFSNIEANTTGHIRAAAAAALPVGKRYTLKKPLPVLVDFTPAAGTIFARGNKFAAPMVRIEREASQPEVTIEYRIENKYTNNVIYRATQEGDVANLVVNPDPQPVGDPVAVIFTHATGIGAAGHPANPNNEVNDGMIDLKRDALDIPGGEYLVYATLNIPSKGVVETLSQKLIIALADDLAITNIEDPKPKDRKKYLINNVIPLGFRVTNLGLTDVSSYTAKAKIYRNDSNVLVYERTKVINLTTALSTGDFSTVSFDNFSTNQPQAQVGDYRIEYVLIKPGKDDEPRNNVYPAATAEPFLVEVAYDIEPGVLAINAPVGNVYVNRPVMPQARFINNGLDDLSDVPVVCTIIGPKPSTNIVYQDSSNISDISSSQNLNTTNYTFPTLFGAPLKGVYTLKVELKKRYDRVASNNIMTQEFTVIDAMKGTYTIGTTNSGQATNFTTIESAIDAIYLRGLSGSVSFELTDAIYNIGDKTNTEVPALDLSSKITGASAMNTITFKASAARAVSKAGVVINLKSGNGIGVYIAQNIEPKSVNAPVKIVNDAKLKFYANSMGYIKFDGGTQKALKFVLDTDNPFRSAFYFGIGASNNTIKNCIIDGGATPTFLSALPGTYKNTSGGFSFQDDKRSATSTYTAGIVMRSKSPINAKFNANQNNLDTLANNNNTISNNEISGFAYGIASMGTGYLFKAGGTNKYVRYYNTNNTIENNKIFNVGKAAIFLGFEENTVVKGNRIFNIGGKADDANGIIIGSKVNDITQGYNAIGIKIKANEISNLSSDKALYGVKIEQSPLLLPVNGTTTIFPNVPEAIELTSNVIWEMMPTGANKADVSRFGIMIRTERKDNKFMEASNINYATRNDIIANNTIIINGDDGVMNKAAIAGVALQQANGTMIKNNAIAVMDLEVAPENNINAAIFYNGANMTKHTMNSAFIVDNSSAAITSDRNVYWTGNSASTIYRYIKTDDKTKTLYAGNKAEYQTLDQWQNVANQDINSVRSNFINDHVFVSNNPQNLRIKSAPSPLNSVLNNHGDVIAEVTSDLNGQTRGVAGQRFDIGAFEFNGRQFISDLQVMKITSPAAYKANAGARFDDAEYIMTTSPIEVSTKVRNNGSLLQTANKITVKIYRENADGTFNMASPVATVGNTVTLASAEEMIINFDLDKGATQFKPQTYSDLRLDPTYKNGVPAQFKNMTANVTPRYRIEIELESDEENNNNKIYKDVRFFIRKSWLHMIVSSDFVGAALTPTSKKDVIAGSLNHDALIGGLKDIGWEVIIDPTASTIDNDRFDYDVLDRNNWEPRTVNYGMYRTMLWSDNHDQTEVTAGNFENVSLAYFAKEDIKSYIAAGTDADKKNLIVASQEMIRNNDALYVNPMFRAVDRVANDKIDMTKITGANIGRHLKNTLKTTTGVAGDVVANPALVDVYLDGNGIARSAYYYTSVKPGEKAISESEKIMSVATTTIGSNRAYLGADWRHFGNIEQILRQTFDFVETNGGVVFPIEMLSFDANQIANRVSLTWATASEENSSHFVIERSELNEAGINTFTSISNVDAAGRSGSRLDYSANDASVEFGNTYVYRLKLVETDGSFEYSEERTVEVLGNVDFSIGQVSPNPVKNTATVKLGLATSSHVEADLFDAQGNKVLNINNEDMQAGAFLTIDAANISNGAYTLVIRIGNAVVRRQVRIVK